MADRRREEGSTVVAQIHRSRVPYLFALSILYFPVYLPIIQRSICCMPCSDVVFSRSNGKVIGGSCLLKLGLLEATESLIRLGFSFISYYFSSILSTPMRDLKSDKFWKKTFSVVQ